MPVIEDCPFCGSSRTELVAFYRGDMTTKERHIECQDCGAMGPKVTHDPNAAHGQAAWREWNKRVIEGVQQW